MSYDGLVMNGVALECERLLVGARVEKIAQPNKNEIILHLRNQGQNHKLMISTQAQEARVHLTSTTPPNPDSPPVFCMVLRKHLEGGRILSIHQQGMDRILHINISAMNEFGDLREKRLIAEIMGKHSNLILVDPDSDRIIDSMKRITGAVNRYRRILPGESYIPPPPTDKYPLNLEREDTIATRLLRAGASQALDQVILSTYDGLGPLSVQELIHRADASPIDSLEYYGQADYFRLFQVISALSDDITENAWHPEILLQDGSPKDFSAIALSLFPTERRQAFDSLNEMLDAFFLGRSAANLFRQKQRDLEQIIRREQERCRKKAGLQAESIMEGKEATKWQLFGKLLTAHHYHIRQGTEAEVHDYSDPENRLLVIPMDPRLSPMENAQSYFKRYQKAAQAAKMAQVFYDDTLQELVYLDSLAFYLTTVRDSEELAGIREELSEAGYIRTTGTESRRSGKKTKKPASGPRGEKGPKAKKNKSRDSGEALGRLRIQGFEILFGNNNRQNDYLNMKVAKAGDLWFHAQSFPGAHVIVRNPEKKVVPEDVVGAAAKICLWHSQARTAGRAAIDYTLRQNVWKPKGAKPGMMLYEQFQTLYITAEEEDIRLLLNLRTT